MPIAGLAPPSLSGSFQSGPQIAQARDRLTKAVMNSGGMMMDSPSVGDYGPTAFDPNALSDFRAASENNDPYARLGARWAPDKVTMPITETPPAVTPNPGRVNPDSLQRAIANQPALPTTGYRPQLSAASASSPIMPQSLPSVASASTQAPQMAGIQKFFGGPQIGSARPTGPFLPRVLRRIRARGLR